MPHTEDAEETGRRVVLELPELSNVYNTHHDDSSCATTPEDATVEAANPGRKRQDFSEGMSSLSGQALGHWHRKGEHVPTVWSIISDKDEITGISKAIQRRLMTAEITPHSKRTVGGRTEMDCVCTTRSTTPRDCRRKLHLEVQAAQNKVAEAGCRVGEAMEEMAKIRSLMEANLGSANR